MDRLADKLTKLLHRLEGKSINFPSDLERDCPTCGRDVSFHLAGLFLKLHGHEILEALKNDKR